jgi:hypothetical protein
MRTLRETVSSVALRLVRGVSDHKKFDCGECGRVAYCGLAPSEECEIKREFEQDSHLRWRREVQTRTAFLHAVVAPPLPNPLP